MACIEYPVYFTVQISGQSSLSVVRESREVKIEKEIEGSSVRVNSSHVAQRINTVGYTGWGFVMHVVCLGIYIRT